MKFEKVESLPTNKAWLQFTAVRKDAGNVRVYYELILPLRELDCRGTFDNEGFEGPPDEHGMVWLDKSNRRHLPLGGTVVGTGNLKYPFNDYYPDQIDLPYRDGAHSGWDSQALGDMPRYYVTSDAIYLLKPEDKST
jgi:hypothetical protein